MKMNSSNDDSHVQVKLFTKQEQYAVPDAPYSVPAASSTAILNTLLNAILKETTDSVNDIDFDFLINNEFLRVNLNEHLQERSISTETVIDIEYVERQPAPEAQDCLMHDDWVSSVQASKKWILTGSYDGTVHIWTKKGKELLTIPAHKESVKAVSWISFIDNIATFVSVSHDQTANIWQWDEKTNTVECIVVCKGHEKGLECVAVSPDSSRMATGSLDANLKIWSASPLDTESGESTSKRSKSQKGRVRTPVTTIQAHKEDIVSVRWMDENTIATASWDHTIKLWDLIGGGIKSEIAGNKAFFSLDYSKLNNMFITSADRHIRLYDPRSNEGSIIKQTFTSHDQWVKSVCWSNTDEHLFISGAFDNQVKLWDSRSPKAPLYNLLGHTDHVLCCDWTNPKYLISGSKDNTVQIFKSKHAIK